MTRRVAYRDIAATAADAAALVSVDHPTVSAAVADCAAGGVPVFALLSPLDAPGLAGYVFCICHERSPAAVVGLLDGTVDLVIESPAEAIARTVTRAMARALAGAALEAAGHTTPFRVVTAENV